MSLRGELEPAFVLYNVDLYLWIRKGFSDSGRKGINVTVIFVYTMARAVQSRLGNLLLRDFREFQRTEIMRVD